MEEHPEYKLLSKGKLFKKLEIEGISKKEINEYFNPKELHQIYSKPKSYKSLKITAPPYSFQIDVALLPTYAKQNKGIDKFLLCIDILSRKAFAYPLKSGKMSDVIVAYEKFLGDVGEQLNSVAGDDFFNNKAFKDLNDDMLINVYTDVAKDDHIIPGKGDKLGIADRCIRTIKMYIQKYMLAHKDLKWTKYLGKIIDLYNDTSNSGIKDSTPNEVFDDHDYMIGLYKGQKKHNEKVNESYDLEPGDRVRAMVGKGIFEKEKAKFSTTIYTISEQVGYRFVLVDEDGKTVKRKYRAGELLKVKGNVEDRIKENVVEKAKAKHKSSKKVAHEHKQIDYVPDQKKKKIKVKSAKGSRSKKFEEDVGGETHTEIEKFLKKKVEDGITYYQVKWSGFSSKHNEWIKATQLKEDLSSDAFRKFKGALK